MPSLASLASLLIQETKEAIYSRALALASSLGLPVTSWQAGDPTRSLYHLESETLSILEKIVVGYIASGFLDYATGWWLKILAKQVYDVDVPAATFAETDVVLTNSGGGVYDVEPGDLTFQSSNGNLYRNTTGGTLAAAVIDRATGSVTTKTLTVHVVAELAGSGSSAGAGTIDKLVTSLLGVSCTNPTAAEGVDEQSEEATRQQCRDKWAKLSLYGPKDAYSCVARDSNLTGTGAVNRVRPYPDSDTGEVLLYVGGPSGSISDPDLAKVTDAIVAWATPLCVTPEVTGVRNVVVPVTCSIWTYSTVNQSAADVQAAVTSKLATMFASKPIGGDIIPGNDTGALYLSAIQDTISGTFPQIFRVVITSPANDVALGNGDVATLGVVSADVHFVDAA
ncbi:MAG: baseplate J/gp47 family protein [Polyangiaceae bacterium]|nr:baseplate J/gp47 family protein [Polyangiaceae bacterium]